MNIEFRHRCSQHQRTHSHSRDMTEKGEASCVSPFFRCRPWYVTFVLLRLFLLMRSVCSLSAVVDCCCWRFRYERVFDDGLGQPFRLLVVVGFRLLLGGHLERLRCPDVGACEVHVSASQQPRLTGVVVPGWSGLLGRSVKVRLTCSCASVVSRFGVDSFAGRPLTVVQQHVRVVASFSAECR